MEDLAVALFAIIFSIISAVSKSKKKKEKAARKQLQPLSQPPKAEKPVVAVPAMSVWPEDEKPAPGAVPAAPAIGQDGADPCHDYMLPKAARPTLKTLENHKPAAPVIGSEGTDACHEFMLGSASAPQTEELDETGLSREQAQDLLRGIIFSEIMARPAQRFAGRCR